MSKTVAYVRVSTKDQNLERQLAVLKALGIEEKYIYQEFMGVRGVYVQVC